MYSYSWVQIPLNAGKFLAFLRLLGLGTRHGQNVPKLLHLTTSNVFHVQLLRQRRIIRFQQMSSHPNISISMYTTMLLHPAPPQNFTNLCRSLLSKKITMTERQREVEDERKCSLWMSWDQQPSQHCLQNFKSPKYVHSWMLQCSFISHSLSPVSVRIGNTKIMLRTWFWPLTLHKSLKNQY